MKKTNIQKTAKYLGNLVMILAVIMIFRRLHSYDIDYSIIFKKKNLLKFVITIILYCVCVLLGVIPWKNNINLLGNKSLNFCKVAGTYTKANIYKYIPGNIFQYVGRNELAVQQGISHTVVAFATILDVIGIVGSIFFLAILLGWRNLVTWIQENYLLSLNKIVGLLVIFLVISGVFLCLCIKKKREIHQLSNYLWTHKVSFATNFLINFVTYAVQSLLNASLYLWIFSVISPTTYQVESITTYLGVIMISFVVGYITPGAPGGIGIREAVILFFLQRMIAEETILTGTIIMRLFAIIGDLLTFCFVWIGIRIKKNIATRYMRDQRQKNEETKYE